MKHYLPYYHWEPVLGPVIQAIGPCKIYAMGLAAQHETISVFQRDICNRAGAFGNKTGTPDSCFLLVLIESDGPRAIHVCRDKIEYLSDRSSSMAMIPWVMSYSKFNYLLKNGDYFAFTVYNSAILCYNSLPTISQGVEAGLNFEVPKFFWHTPFLLVQQEAASFAERAHSLMAGVRLYFRRKEYALAALLLHQSAEQFFTAIVYSKTGHRPQSHHIGRLYEYARFVCPSLASLWPAHSAETHAQLRHLNKAYLEARYGNYEANEDTLRSVARKLYEAEALTSVPLSIAA